MSAGVSTFKREVRAYKRRNFGKLLGQTYVCVLLILCVLGIYYNFDRASSQHVGRELLECIETPAAKEEHAFPEDIFSAEDHKSGLIVLHVIGVLYSFAGLAIICDSYFEPSLNAIGNALRLSPDVNGATFMAAGSSAPELFASILGVFVAKSDVGIGTIVGSAVFNMLIILAAIGIVMRKEGGIGLRWYPVTRDISFYSFSIIILVIVMSDQEVSLHEGAYLMALYLAYIIWMKFNAKIEKKCNDFVDAPYKQSNCQKIAAKFADSIFFNVLVYTAIILNIVFLAMTIAEEDEPDWYVQVNNAFSIFFILEMVLKIFGYGMAGYWNDIYNTFDGLLVMFIIVEYALENSGMSGGLRGLRVIKVLRGLRALRILRLIRLVATSTNSVGTQTDPNDLVPGRKTNNKVAKKQGKQKEGETIQVKTKNSDTKSNGSSTDDSKENPVAKKTPKRGKVAPVDSDSPKKGSKTDQVLALEIESPPEAAAESSDDEVDPPWEIPDGAGAKATWLSMCTIYFLYYLTVPDCSKERWKKWYMVSFFMSIFWITVWSYLMVWMSTILGEFIGIPSAVMGLTFLAAGTSLPDTLASVSVAQKGEGDMAVSNAIGSNVFDICVCLAVPWFINTAITGESAKIFSSNLTLMIFTLFLIVAFVLITLKLEGKLHAHTIIDTDKGADEKAEVEAWHLTPRLGYIFLFLYALFVAESLLLEYNILCV